MDVTVTCCQLLLLRNDHVTQVKTGWQEREENLSLLTSQIEKYTREQKTWKSDNKSLLRQWVGVVWDILWPWFSRHLMTNVSAVGNKLLEMCNRGNTEKESCMDEERECQPQKKLSHSIEEILRRPACLRKEKRVHRNWSVIKVNTRISNQLPCAGMVITFFKALLQEAPKSKLWLKYDHI